MRITGGELVLLRPDNLQSAATEPAAQEEEEEEEVELEQNDEVDDVELEANVSDADDDDLQLEANEDHDVDDDDDDSSLRLEKNGEEEEEEEESDELALEENTDGDDEEEDQLQLEQNLQHTDCAKDDVHDDDDFVLVDDPSELGATAGLEATGGNLGDTRALNSGGGSAPPSGLEEALQALQGGEGRGGEMVRVDDALRPLNGVLIDPDSFLIPSARAKLEEAEQLHPIREGESDAAYRVRLIQMLTRDNPPEAFHDGARQLVEAYGVELIAERMRGMGDDHFAAGAYPAAHHAYSAGIAWHDGAPPTAPEHQLSTTRNPPTPRVSADPADACMRVTETRCDAAHLMHCHVNRAAARLKLGLVAEAVEDADAALAISRSTYAPTTERKARLRRAQALLALGRFDDAETDAGSLGSSDAAAGALLLRIADARVSASVSVEDGVTWVHATS